MEKLMTEVLELDNVQVVKLKWYHYSQNNSGGHFIVDDMVANDIFVQARNAAEANLIAEKITEDSAMSWCECCGERWYISAYEDSGMPVPSTYEGPYYPGGLFRDEARFHYYDGRVEKIDKDNPPKYNTVVIE
jgi:hypothetical protein